MDRFYTSDESLILVLSAYLLPQAGILFMLFSRMLITYKINITKDILVSLISKGSGFFYFNLMAVLVLQVDYIILSQTVPSEDIIEYNTLGKVFSLGFFIYSALLLSLWPFISEKIAIGESYVVKKILKNKIIGITCHNSINLVKQAIKSQPNYIALGAFYSSKTKKVKFKANIQILKYVKTMTKIPIVAIGGIKSNNYKKLLLNKANFLAISGYIWNNKKLKPIEAINKLK
mgnify:CR=1 FL=1